VQFSSCILHVRTLSGLQPTDVYFIVNKPLTCNFVQFTLSFSEGKCPYDNKVLTRVDIKRPDRKVEEHEKTLYGKCRYDSKELRLPELRRHERTCPSRPKGLSTSGSDKFRRAGSAVSAASAISRGSGDSRISRKSRNTA